MSRFVKLIREYPLRNLGLMVNNQYEVVDESIYHKRVTSRCTIPIGIITIKNENGELIDVNKLFFVDIY